MAHRLPRHAPAAPTSPGRVMTKWTKPAATASPNSMHTGRSPARSVSTMAMNPASKPALGDFFNSLLAPLSQQHQHLRARLQGHRQGERRRREELPWRLGERPGYRAGGERHYARARRRDDAQSPVRIVEIGDEHGAHQEMRGDRRGYERYGPAARLVQRVQEYRGPVEGDAPGEDGEDEGHGDNAPAEKDAVPRALYPQSFRYSPKRRHFGLSSSAAELRQ